MKNSIQWFQFKFISGLMTVIGWSLIHLCLEYDLDRPTLFPPKRKKKKK